MFEICLTGKRVVKFTDHGKTLSFEFTQYTHGHNTNYANIFKPVQLYLENQPATTRRALFNYYSEALEIIRSGESLIIIEHQLTEVVGKIYRLIKLEDVTNFLIRRGELRVPSEIKMSFKDVDDGYTKERTYIHDEYRDLLIYAVMLRFILPIWCEYSSKLHESRKELTVVRVSYYLYLLLKGTDLVTCPTYHRLNVYVQSQITTGANTAVCTLLGLGVDEIPEWFLSDVINKKLTVFDVYNPKVNLISAISKVISYGIKKPTTGFANTPNYRARTAPKNEKDDGQEQSFIETYRGRVPPFGLVETNAVYLMNPIEKICTDLDVGFNPEIGTAVAAVTQGIENITIEDFHHQLALWVLDKSLITMSLDIVEKEVTLNAMRATQALLHHWGLHSLALLATAARIDDESGEFSGQGETMSNVPLHLLDMLDEVYPWAIPGAKTSDNLNTRMANYGYIAIHELTAFLMQYKFIVRTPAFLTSKDVDVDQYGGFFLPGTTLTEFAKLLVILNHLNEHPNDPVNPELLFKG